MGPLAVLTARARLSPPGARSRRDRRPAGRPVTALAVGVLAVQACSPAAPPPPSAPPSTTPALAAPFPSIVLDTQDPAAAGYGFTAVDATPSQLGGPASRQPVLVWLGGYDNATCTWTESDDEVRSEFTRYAMATDARVLGYFLADEPNTDGHCPGASAQVRARAALVRGLDPDQRHITLANIDDPAQFAAFRDTVDVLSTDPYPCAAGGGCNWSLIPSYVARLRAAGVVHYMGMLQAFSGEDWRWPTAAELQRMIEQWRRSDWCGALTFSWSYLGGRLTDHPDLLAVLRDFNSHPPAPGTPCA